MKTGQGKDAEVAQFGPIGDIYTKGPMVGAEVWVMSSFQYSFREQFLLTFLPLRHPPNPHNP
jgi:hypothetical protein